jgi:mannose/cellobiose epimerase-like protein (N-acyl-D-glucosamine 2-epimerase family)
MRNAKAWLKDHALPLWLNKGIDRENGGFLESLTLEGEPMTVARRAMVQSRQIYTFRTAIENNLCPIEPAKKAVASGLDFLINKFSQPSGAFIHSVDVEGKAQNTSLDLYTQAFSLFGMANAYAVQGDPNLVARAKALVEYLQRERRVLGGGFTEFENGKIVYRSNPHMHLFEAAIFWAEVHKDPVWLKLANEVLDLCQTKFMDPVSGFIGEYFTDRWQRINENGKFVFEPGHQFEWSWLMGRFEKISGKSLCEIRLRLYNGAEKHGLSQAGMVIDEVWSDHTPKLQSSRFWPQCERIKAAVDLADHQAAAEQGMKALFRFFDLPIQGLWYDTLEASGEFRIQPVKASSFYHIMGAVSEYLRLNLK